MTPENARSLLNDAVKRGDMIRPETCARCGIIPPPASDGRAVIHGHHHDYNKPLDVEWICPKCHRAETRLPDKMGGPVFGERNGASKLDAAIVLSAKRLRGKGLTYQSIADRFGVDETTIMRAIKGTHWGHITAAGGKS